MYRKFLVRDWMTIDPITVSVNTSLPDAHSVMKDKKIRRLPVFDGDKLVGIVTLGDIRGARPTEATALSIWEIKYLLNRLCAKDVMSSDVITVDADATIAEAAQLMLENKIAGLPALRENHIIGIITESDIFRMVVEVWDSEVESFVIA